MTTNFLKEKKFFELGYVVFKNWLKEEEVEILLNQYYELRKNRNENKDNVYYMNSEILSLIKMKVKSILLMVNDENLEERLFVDLITPYMLFTNTETVNFPWHQDHESYWIFQQHKNYLNFYMILDKENSEKSGLSLIPLNIINDRFPENIRVNIINSGAKVFEVDKNKTVIYNQQNGDKYHLDFNIDECSVTPELRSGDLLLFRGDVIHKTQDSETHRIAASIRCTDSSAKIKLSHLMETCDVKSGEMSKRMDFYCSLYDKLSEKKEILAKDLISDENYIV